MSSIIVLFITIFGIFLGKIIFKNLVNHLTIYSFIMGGLTFLYELKLLPYPELVPLTWFLLGLSFIAIILGTLTYITAKSINPNWNFYIPNHDINMPIFSDKGKTLKYALIFFSLIGLFVAVQRWYVLIGKFGSIQSVFLNAAVVYRMNVQGEIKEFIPILPSFVYVGILLSGIYTAYNRKFTFLTFFPLLTIVMKELTYFGRGEMLFASMEFFFSFFLFRQLLKKDIKKRYSFSKPNAILAMTLLIVLMILASSLVRISRGVKESYKGTSHELKELESTMIITPSVYLYLSSDIGVFSKFLEKDSEKTKFGQNTFRLVYDILASLNAAEKVPFFQKGYFIPMWTNTGTFLREIYADFGVFGVIFIPFLLGLILSKLFYDFIVGKSLITFSLMVYFYIIVGFSFLMMTTRLNQWIFSLTLIFITIPIINSLAVRNAKTKQLS